RRGRGELRLLRSLRVPLDRVVRWPRHLPLGSGDLMSLDVLETWRTLLGEISELGGALCHAIETNDVLGAVAAMMQLRSRRAAIARVEAPVRLRGDASELAVMAEVSTL